MATIAENITIIKNSIDRMKEALNLPSNTPLENLTLAVEDGGGSSGGSTTYTVSSIEERDSLTGVKEGDFCVVEGGSTLAPITDINGIQTLYFPDEIPYTPDMVSCMIKFPLEDGTDTLTCYCNPGTSTDMRFGFYLGSWSPTIMAYACTDGKTFTKMANFVDVDEYTLSSPLTSSGSNIDAYPWVYNKIYQPTTTSTEMFVYVNGGWVSLNNPTNPEDSSGVYKVATIEERDALLAKEGDICLVHTVAEFNYDGTQTSNMLILPDTITAETPITASASTSLLYGSSSMERLLCQLSATYFRIRDYNTMDYLAQYTSTDGITYKKTLGDTHLTFSQDLQPQGTFNAALTPFIFMKGVRFEGIFTYKESTWNYLDIGADTSDPLDVYSGKRVYTNYGNIEGTSFGFNGKTFNRCMNYINTTPSVKGTDMSYMFDNLYTLTSAEVANYITQYIDTSNLTNLAYAFNNNRTTSAITSLDVSSFNTSNVIDMDHAFSRLISLTSLNLSGFDFQKAKSLSGLVSGCSGLTSLSLPTTEQNCVAEDISFIMSSVKVSSINMSNFKFPKVKNLSSAFYGTTCTTLRLPDFTGAKPTMMNMFINGAKATTITNLNTIDYSEVEDLTSAFAGIAASSLNIRTDCVTSKLKTVMGMFNGAANLTSINLPNLILSEDAEATALQNFIYQCPKMTTINLRNLNNPGTPGLSVYGMFPTSDSFTSQNNTTALTHIDIRSFDFTLGNLTRYDTLFNKISTSCLIIVKNDACRNWILNNCRNDLTNIKTAAEYGE